MQVYQQVDVCIVCPTRNFIKNETVTQEFPCEFWKFFQPVHLSKTRFQQISFLWNIFQPATLLTVRLWHRCFLASFAKSFKNIRNICEHLRGAASNNMFIARFYLQDLLFIKIKNKIISKTIASWKCRLSL